MTESVPNDFDVLAAELKRLGGEIQAVLPGLVQSRRNYMRTRSAADKADNLRLESAANALGRAPCSPL